MNPKNFIFDATVMVEMRNTDFDILYKNCKHHYDRTVRESITVGNFMNGFKNRRIWAKQDKERFFEAEWSSRQLNLMSKALEMDRSEKARKLYQAIVKIFHELQGEIKRVNNWE